MTWRNWVKPRTGALNTLLAPHYFASGQLVLTKRNDILAVFRLRGIDFECKTDEELESISKRLHTAFRNLNPGFRVYRYAIKTKGVDLAYHRAKDLYLISFYLVLMYEGKPNTRSGLAISRAELDARIEEIENHLGSFVSATGSLLDLERLGYEEIGSFLGQLTSNQPKIKYSDHIDYWAAQTPVIVTEHGLYIDRPVRTLTLRQLPRTTKPNLFASLLRLPCDLILCDEFKRIPNDKAIQIAESFEDHFFYKKNNRNVKSAARDARKSKDEKQDKVQDTVAIENLTEVGQIKTRIANKGEFLGEYSLTLILAGDQLGRIAAEAINTVGNFEGELSLDGTGSLDAYLSVIPGNTSRNLRKQWILSMNYVDLAPVYGPPIGDAMNLHLGLESLCVFETTLDTPYSFNLHENDLLGVLLFGVMGSGKSFLTNKLIAESQKYRPFTFILDIGNSYRQITKEFGGEYLELGRRKEGFAPFSLERTPVNLEFLSTLVHSLLEASGYHPNPRESRLIDVAVRTAESLSDLDLPAELKDALYNWTEGRYAHLFNNKRDTITLADFQTVDFQGVRKQVMGPLFLYIFHLISLAVYDPKNLSRMKQVWADEPWKFVRDIPAAQDYLIEVGKTFRKYNGGLGLTTQSAWDYKGGFLDAMNEICPTKILLFNPGAAKAFYQQNFELNDREVDIFCNLIPKKQFLLKTPSRSAVLSYMPTAEEIQKFSNDPKSNLKREAEQSLELFDTSAA
jgi:type IV secretion system protein VirB4